MTPAPLFTASIVARLPLAALSVGVLVHVQQLTGSFGAAGLASGALAVAQGTGGPALGRLADRHGRTGVLIGAAAVAAGALGALGIAPAQTPVWALLGLAAVLGAATPPVGACLRALLPALVAGAARQRRAYAADATATELTWIAGPPLALLAGAAWGSGPALVTAGVVLLVATTAFAVAPACRGKLGAGPLSPAGSTGALAAPAMRRLVAVLIGVGVLFGATEVAVTAAAGSLGATAAAGPLLGLWGVGSLVGGLVATRLGGGAVHARGFALLLAGLGGSHLLLAPASGRVVTLGVTITVAGSLIAPLLASAYAMVEHAAPAGTATEAFAWLATATAIGTSAGAAVAGALADTAGPAAAFVLAGAAALTSSAVAARRIRPVAARLTTA